MKKFEVIAFDLDGTLAESKSPVKSDMVEALGHLLKKYKVVVISGAALPQFKEQFYRHLTYLGEVLENLYIMPTSGTALCNFYPEEKCTYMYTFTPEEKQEVFDALEKAFVETGFQKPEKAFGELIEDRGQQITFSALGQKAPLEFKQKWDPTHEKRRQLVSVLEKLLPNFSVHVGGSTSIDITRKGVDKASGLKMMMEMLGVEEDKVLYIGDELTPMGNDSPVLTLGIDSRPVKGPTETIRVINELLELNFE